MKKRFCFVAVLFPILLLGQEYTGPIIDMHVHAYTKEASPEMFMGDHPNPLKGEVYKVVKTGEEQFTETMKQFDTYKIVKAVVSDGHLWKSSSDERILVSGRNMPAGKLKELYEQGKLDAIGELNPFYGGVTADDESLRPLFSLAEELEIPLGFHIMPGGPPGAIYHLGMKEVRVSNAHPLQLEEILVRHPNLKIYVMHGGWPYLEDMKAMMYAHPHLYIDVAAINWILPLKEFHHFLQGLVDAGFGKRIMFGSDQMTFPETIGIGIDAINAAKFLTLEQKEDIFYNNAATFLGLSPEEIAKHKSVSR